MKESSTGFEDTARQGDVESVYIGARATRAKTFQSAPASIIVPITPDPREPQIPDRLRELIRPYSKNAVLRAANEHPRFTWAATELLAVALSTTETGAATSVPEGVLTDIWVESQFALSPVPGALRTEGADLQSQLRQSRGFHQVWYSAPLFAELLAPFDEDLRAQVGYSADEIFTAAAQMTETKPSQIPPPELVPVFNDITVSLDNATSFSALWNAAIIEHEGVGHVLTNKLAEVLYRILNDRLNKTPKFGNKKRKSLESFVRRRLEPLMPNWRWESNYFIEGNEKDLMGFGRDAGIAVECQGFKFRPTAAAWSALNAKSDAGPVIEAISQIEQPMKVLTTGGTIDVPRLALQPHRIVQGIVVTDNVHTPYVRASLDNWAQGEGLQANSWHGSNIWIASMIDLDFVIRCARRMSIFLDYLRTVRAHANVRYSQEVDAYQMHTTEVALPLAGRSINVITQGFDWDKLHAEGFQRMFPAWLKREADIIDLERKDVIAAALRYIDQDRRAARKLFRTKLPPGLR